MVQLMTSINWLRFEKLFKLAATFLFSYNHEYRRSSFFFLFLSPVVNYHKEQFDASLTHLIYSTSVYMFIYEK